MIQFIAKDTDMKTLKNKYLPVHDRFVWAELMLMLLWTFLMCVYIAPGSFTAELRIMLQNPLLLFLNIMPPAVLLLVLYFVTANSFISGGVTNLIFGLLSYVNLLKIDGRDDPFVPADITLLREALTATGEYRLDMHYGIVAILLLSTVVLLALGIVIGRGKRPRTLVRIGGALLSLAVFFGCFFTLYRDRELYASFPVSNEYNITTVFNELGFNYCFLYNTELYSVDKPEGYSQSDIEKFIDEFEPTAPETDERPQVIYIMCEAFSDLNADDAFAYTEEDSPLSGYFKVIESPNSISGKLVVPNFGAGTANTEFDVIGEMQTNMISRTSNSALRSFHKNTPSVAYVMRSLGYGTLFMHPGESWFYNRDSAMSFLGFEDKIFAEAFGETPNLDTAFLETLKSEISSRTSDGEKLFTYATTIQNHQAYNYTKYPTVDITPVKTNVELSAEAQEYLSVYSYGIECSSNMLFELTEYLNALDEPYVLVFFGDHLPNLGPDYLSYRELGLDIGKNETPEQVLDSCSVPYIIWGNDAYLKGDSMADRAEKLDLPEDGRISACFLSSAVMELLGYDGCDAYTSFMCELRRELPVIKSGIVCRADGEITDSPTPQEQELINKLHCWQYYRMMTEKTS